MKIRNIFFLFGVFFLLLVFSYIFRYEISSKIFSALDYNDQKARRYSFLLLETPFKSLNSRLRAYISPKLDLEGVLNNTLEIKSSFLNYEKTNLKFKNGNYFFDVFETQNRDIIDVSASSLKFSGFWDDKPIEKAWIVGMSNQTDSDDSSKSLPLISQATPKICGEKIIYARQDGNIGAVDFRTGKKFWHKKFENVRALRIKGFFCEYNKNLDTYVILYPTGSGVFCIDAKDGSLITSRCKGGRLGGYESRVSPQLVDDTVYVATIKPSGIAAYDFITGKLKWRTEFEIGKFFLKGGSNPWSNFIIDKKNQILFVNTGSPVSRFEAGSAEKYKYSGSLIAISLKNGKIIWQFQEILGDTSNLDLVGQPILLPKKIKGKEIVVTLSKTGSIYFIDRERGLPVFPIKEEKINLGKFKYNFKQSTVPRPFFDQTYFENLSENYKSNTFVFGYFPSILKMHRVANAEIFQWPGGALDKKNNYLILPSNHNYTTELYTDFEPDPLLSLNSNLLVQKCTSCHDSKGKVKIEGKKIVPSLFLTSKIHTYSSLKKYLDESRFHNELDFEDKDLLKAYSIFKNYDQKVINDKNFRPIHFYRHTSKKNKDIYLNSGVLGKISAISLDTGKIIWQIPAGTYKVNENQVLIGSPSYGGIASIQDRDNQSISFFTGSYDKKIYAINNDNGNYVWSDDLPASGSSIPLIHETDNERWIFVVATGGRLKGDSSDSLVAFRQKLD